MPSTHTYPYVHTETQKHITAHRINSVGMVVMFGCSLDVFVCHQVFVWLQVMRSHGLCLHQISSHAGYHMINHCPKKVFMYKRENVCLYVCMLVCLCMSSRFLIWSHFMSSLSHLTSLSWPNSIVLLLRHHCNGHYKTPSLYHLDTINTLSSLYHHIRRRRVAITPEASMYISSALWPIKCSSCSHRCKITSRVFYVYKFVLVRVCMK